MERLWERYLSALAVRAVPGRIHPLPGVALLVANELEPVFYMLRVVAYGLILLAIWQKNQPRKKE